MGITLKKSMAATVASFCFIGLPGFAAELTKEAWNYQNDPDRFGALTTVPLSALPASARLADDKLPWSGSYWPTYKGGISHRWRTGTTGASYRDFTYDVLNWDAVSQLSDTDLSRLSPAEKYDIFVGDSSFGLTRDEKRRVTAGLRDGEVPSWFGICDGWAAASISVPEPLEAFSAMSPNGQKITFMPSDVQALLGYAFAHANLGAVFLGQRCSQETPATDPDGRPVDSVCRDANPGAFHLTLIEMIADRQQPFLADINSDHQVWNQPIIGFSAQLSAARPLDDTDPLLAVRARGTTHLVDALTSVSYVTGASPSDDAVGAHTNARLFRYTLELDAQGRIIGGEWATPAHPDFLWLPKRMPPSRVAAANFDVIKALLSGSRGGDLTPDPNPDTDPAGDGAADVDVLSVVDVQFPASVRVNEVATATVTLRNGAADTTRPGALTVSMEPAVVTFDVSRPVAVPALAPGEEVDLPVSFTPGIWSGSNQLWNVEVKVAGAAGTELVQTFSRRLVVDRSASLFLCNGSDCLAARPAVVRVRAGRTVVLPVNFHMQTRNTSGGPYSIRAAGFGHAGLGIASNTMISTDLGWWHPASGDYLMPFRVVVPGVLAGQTSYAQFSLIEGGREIHRLYVPLAIE